MIKKRIVIVLTLLAGVAGHLTAQTDDRGFEIAKNLEIFSNVYKQLNLNYVDDVDPGKTIKVAIDAMLASLDPYTNYYPESQMEDVKLQLLGQYGGIGSLIMQKGDSVYISEPYKGLPADEAGIRAGDRIVAVDGQSTEGKTTQDVSSAMRGQAGTDVVLRLERDGKMFDVTVKRREIKLPNVPYYGYVGDNKDFGYIKLDEFTTDAAKHVRDAFVSLKNENPKMKGIILDLRGNGGGLMNEAVDIVNIWVPRGVLVVETKGKVASKNIKSYTRFNPEDTEIPLAVLIDGGSASASEIVSGSLQDLDRAVIIGQRSYGKGLVQNILPMAYNSQMKVTVSKYYIPSGRCIQAIDYSHRDEQGRQYVRTHKDLPPASEFEVSDELYADFCRYLKDKNLSYSTVTERVIQELRDVAKEEKYADAIEQQIKDMEAALKREKEGDLQKHREEICDMLRAELLVRYYYDEGRVEGGLKHDKVVLRAIEELKK